MLSSLSTYHAESYSFEFSNQCCFTFNKEGHSNMMTLVNPNKESKDEIVLVHSIIKSKHKNEKEGER